MRRGSSGAGGASRYPPPRNRNAPGPQGTHAGRTGCPPPAGSSRRRGYRPTSHAPALSPCSQLISALAGENVEVLVGVERRHATGTGGGDRLAVHLVHHVAGGENAGDAGGGGVPFDAALHHDVAVLHLELVLEEL